MRSILKSQKLGIMCLVGLLTLYTRTHGPYWLLVVEWVAIAVLALWQAVEFYGEYAQYKKEKASWDVAWDRIRVAAEMVRLSDDTAAHLNLTTLQYWHKWVTEHKEDQETRQAFIDICTAAVGLPSESFGDSSVQAAAQAALAELARSEV